MPQFIISYDLSSAAANAHSAFKRHAQERQWSDRIQLADGRLAALPNTTLCGEFVSFHAAEAAVGAALEATRAELRQPVAITVT